MRFYGLDKSTFEERLRERPFTCGFRVSPFCQRHTHLRPSRQCLYGWATSREAKQSFGAGLVEHVISPVFGGVVISPLFRSVVCNLRGSELELWPWSTCIG